MLILILLVVLTLTPSVAYKNIMWRGRPMGDGISLTEICTLIILIASTITASVTIWNAVKKPAEKYKQKHDSEVKDLIVSTLQEVLPELFEAHDKEVKEQITAAVKTAVLEDISSKLDEVEILRLQYETLTISAKDVLREKIIKIYLDHKDTKQMPIIEREKLDQFYKDYKALKGNSYIDKYYRRMSKWAVIDDIDDDDDAII